MLQIIYTTVFPVKRLNNLTGRVWLFNRFNSENRGIHDERISQIKQNSLLLEMLSTFEENFTKSNQDVHKAGYEHEISIKK